MEKVAVILINYNGKKYNDACIASVLESKDVETRAIVVDNASTDDSLMLLTEKWGKNPRVSIISMKENTGFSGGNNAGIRQALEQGYHYILLLNNDTEIDALAIQKMVACQKETDSIIVPKIYFADKRDTIWCAGGYLTPIIKKAVQRGNNRKDTGEFDESGYCSLANGCCVLLTDSIIQKTGMLDERFFLYYEDTEYSMRALEKQVKIYYCHDAAVYHKVNGSTGGNDNPANAYYITRNWLMCNKSHMKGRFYLFVCYFLVNRTVCGALWVLQGKRELTAALVKGFRDYLKGKTGKLEG